LEDFSRRIGRVSNYAAPGRGVYSCGSCGSDVPVFDKAGLCNGMPVITGQFETYELVDIDGEELCVASAGLDVPWHTMRRLSIAGF